MSKNWDDILYEKILYMKIDLRDVHLLFQPYSANDIKKLIASKRKGVREPKDLQHLYKLVDTINDLQIAFTEAAKESSES
jgi:hypothetical protein